MTGRAPSVVQGLRIATVCSGAAALVAETMWIRSFSLIVGSTVEAASAMFAAFLVGLALGAFAFGRRSDRLERPLWAYLWVEIGIAISSAATGFGLFHLQDVLVAGSGEGRLAHAVTAFGTVLCLVLVPTALMGATFPLMVSAARRAGAGVSVIGRLYGLNTLGASLGALGCGFVLISSLGVRGTILAGALLNVAAACACVPSLRFGNRADGEGEVSSEAPTVGQPPAQPISLWLLLSVAAASGAMVLGLEVTWTRLASYFLGNRTYAFSTLLASVLVMLAFGAWASEKLLTWGRRRLPLVLGSVLVVASGLTLACAAAADGFIHRQIAIEAALPASGLLTVPARIVETVLLLGPMMGALGCLFPMSLTAARLSEERSGRAAGLFYFVNTVGSVSGSLLVGFWSISALGTYGSIAAIVAFGAFVAFLVFAAGVSARRERLAGLGLATAVFLAIPAVLPPQLSLVGAGEERVLRKEDEYGVFQVLRLPSGLLKVTNNRTQLVHYLGAFSTSYVQQMQGHLGMFFCPEAKNALVLGSGYGITAGALGTYRQLAQVDAVEIVPAMIEAADLFEPFNLSYHRNPRVRVIQDDGRHFLARSTTRYDIISVNVSDPRLPGSANFFHQEFYELAKRRLAEGGVVIQHAFGTEIATVLSTLAKSFAYVRLFPAYQNGFNVVAADHPLVGDVEKIDRLAAAPEVAAALQSIGILDPLSPGRVFSEGFTPEDFPVFFSRDRIATDDHPLLEFSSRGSAAGLFHSNE